MIHASECSSTTIHPWVSLPVVEIVDQMLSMIRDVPIYEQVRQSLDEFKQTIFIELPNERREMLCRVGEIINRNVPRRGVTNVLFEEFWVAIQDGMNAALRSYL